MSAGGAGAVVRAGHLRKLKTMKKKFFVLRAETPDCSARLEYYESEKKFRSGAVPRRVLPLKSCYNITRRLDLKQKHVIALFTREEQFCVVAENEQDLHGWLTAVLKHHRNEDGSEELRHPIQHVWQVNVQKKGLGASKNIQGLYNLCLTDQTLTLVKIKSQNNVISDLGIPERVEYTLKNIRRCGDSECFFYMEVGRQTGTGAGELWMHTDDANIAQSMHSTIYHAMRNCAKEHENERDHIVVPKAEGSLPARRSTYSDGRGRAGLGNGCGLCAGSCLKPCVCHHDSAATLTPNPAHAPASNAENQPPNSNPLTHEKKDLPRLIKHHRTVSLPTGCPIFNELKPLRIVHERTRSAPLAGDEVDRVILEKTTTHSSCKTVNGVDGLKKTQWSRRASTGTRLSKLSPAHSKNATPLRSRCDSMPSRASHSLDQDARPSTRNDSIDGIDCRDESDAEWHRTPRIPEEPDFCDNRDFFSIFSPSSLLGSVHHSRTSSSGPDDIDGYLPMCGESTHAASAPQAASEALHSPLSGSVCSGTPSTDPRFSEYQLEPATSHIVDMERPPRAYSVGSRPAPRNDPVRHRAYSVGARHKPQAAKHQAAAVCSAPLLPRSSAEDLMELDFSNNSPAAKVVVARTAPAAGFMHPPHPKIVDEYVDMSPRNVGYVEMKPGDIPMPISTSQITPNTPTNSSTAAVSRPTPQNTPTNSFTAGISRLTPQNTPTNTLGSTSRPSPQNTPTNSFTAALSRSPPTDGYVEMNYGKGPTRPIDIARPVDSAIPAQIQRQPLVLSSSPEERRKRNRDRTPLGSQTLFPFSPESPASPPELGAEPTEFEEEMPEMPHHPLTTVREISEDGRKTPEVVSMSPSYVQLCYKSVGGSKMANKSPEQEDMACTPTANKIVARDTVECRVESTATLVLASVGAPARFSVSDDRPPTSPGPIPGPLNYAALDLEPPRVNATPTPTAYTKIDFARSEKLAADGN